MLLSHLLNGLSHGNQQQWTEKPLIEKQDIVTGFTYMDDVETNVCKKKKIRRKETNKTKKTTTKEKRDWELKESFNLREYQLHLLIMRIISYF